MTYDFKTRAIAQTTDALRRNLELALEGDPEALYQLGLSSQSIYGFQGISNDGGLEYFLSASDRGHAKAKVEAASILFERGEKKDLRQAKQLLDEAEALNETSAYPLLGLYYSMPKSPERHDASAEYYLKKSNQYYLLSILYSNRKSRLFDPEKAFRHLEYGGADGDSRAMTVLAAIGWVPPIPSYLAFPVIRERGQDPSDGYDKEQVNLISLCYENGFRVAKDKKMAVELRKRAEQMDPEERVYLAKGKPMSTSMKTVSLK